MRGKELRLENQRHKKKNVKHDGRQTRSELPLGLLFRLLRGNEMNFPGTENVRADEIFRNVQRIRARFRRCGANGHGPALVQVPPLPRPSTLLPDSVALASSIPRD